ncbi:MAG TPA: aspartate/glutamate racemase family protein [Acetobacteraceae bacterium]|nr:aspartate/glutamate racemase family protein [Acetobacteraceae bacterium]
MKLLLINPNVTDAITQQMAAEARRAASAGTEILAVTAAFGTQYIANRAEAAIAGHAVLDALAAHAAGCGAAIVSAFGDPGLAAAREFTDIPVLGIAESAMLTAWMLGRRYAIVCLTPRLRRWYIECAQEHGLDGRLVAVRALDTPVPDITQAKDRFRDRLLAECRHAIEEDEAEVIIFGGGPIAGLAREVAAEIPVPTLDGVSCAVRLAEALVGLNPRPPTRGSFARPEPKPAKGLSPALLRRITGEA